MFHGPMSKASDLERLREDGMVVVVDGGAFSERGDGESL